MFGHRVIAQNKEMSERHATPDNLPPYIKGLPANPHLDYLLAVAPEEQYELRHTLCSRPSRKGGAGETDHQRGGEIAVEAERLAQGPVAILDLDPMGKLAAAGGTSGRPTLPFALE